MVPSPYSSLAAALISSVKVILAYAMALLIVLPSFAAEECDTRFNMLASSPVGSWQLSREISIGRDGKRSGRIIRTSMLGDEILNDIRHYWVEVASQPVRIDASKNIIADGERFIVLSLIPEPVLSCAKESLLNLSQHAVESYVQMGSQPPKRVAVGPPGIKGAGSDSGDALSTRSNRSSHRITDLKAEPIQLSDMTFETMKLNVFRSISNEKANVKARSDIVLWYSSKVPFGVIKTDGTSVVNGNPKKTTRELLEFAQTGATIQMTK